MCDVVGPSQPVERRKRLGSQPVLILGLSPLKIQSIDRFRPESLAGVRL